VLFIFRSRRYASTYPLRPSPRARSRRTRSRRAADLIPSTRCNRHRNFTARAHASPPRFFLGAGIYVGRNGTPSRRPRETLLNGARGAYVCMHAFSPFNPPSPPPSPFCSIRSSRGAHARSRLLSVQSSPRISSLSRALAGSARDTASCVSTYRRLHEPAIYSIKPPPPPLSPSSKAPRADYAGAPARNRPGRPKYFVAV